MQKSCRWALQSSQRTGITTIKFLKWAHPKIHKINNHIFSRPSWQPQKRRARPKPDALAKKPNVWKNIAIATQMGKAAGNPVVVSTAAINKTVSQPARIYLRRPFKRAAVVDAKNRIVLKNTVPVGTIKRNALLAFASVSSVIISPRIKNNIRTFKK